MGRPRMGGVRPGGRAHTWDYGGAATLPRPRADRHGGAVVDRQALPRGLRAPACRSCRRCSSTGQRSRCSRPRSSSSTESGGSRHRALRPRQTEKDAGRLAARIHRSGRTAMVQPYLAGVEGHGETALCIWAASTRTRSTRARCWVATGSSRTGSSSRSRSAPASPGRRRACRRRSRSRVCDRALRPARLRPCRSAAGARRPPGAGAGTRRAVAVPDDLGRRAGAFRARAREAWSPGT